MARIHPALGALLAGPPALANCGSLPGMASASTALGVSEVPADQISKKTTKNVMRILSSDAFESRAGGTAGEEWRTTSCAGSAAGC